MILNFNHTGLKEQSIILKECAKCRWRPISLPGDFIRIGLWPLDTRRTFFFDFNYIYYSSVLQHFSPNLSLGSMLQTLNFISTMEGTVSVKSY